MYLTKLLNEFLKFYPLMDTYKWIIVCMYVIGGRHAILIAFIVFIIYILKKAPEGQYPCKSIQLVEMKKHIKETGFLS